MTYIIGQEKPSLDSLTHHGVKGQRWGVRKEEVSNSVSKASSAVSGQASKAATAVSQHRANSKAENVAKFKMKANVANTKISEIQAANAKLVGTKNPRKMLVRAGNNGTIKDLSKVRNTALKNAEAKEHGKLTSNQKKLIVGGAVVGSLIAGGYLINLQQHGTLNSMSLRGKAFVTGQKSPFHTDPYLSRKDLSIDQLIHDVARPVNPNYKSPGGSMNCRRCTFTYELRRRGYDVAATTASRGTGQSESGFINAVTPESKNFIRGLSVSQSIIDSEGKYFDKVSESTSGKIDETFRRSGGASDDVRSSPLPKTIIRGLSKVTPAHMEDHTLKRSSSAAVLEELSKQPNGARGEVLFNFGTFGHSMAYEIVDGKAHIIDSQKATLYNADHPVESKWDGFNSAEITRLDNVPLDINFLTRWSTNRAGQRMIHD